MSEREPQGHQRPAGCGPGPAAVGQRFMQTKMLPKITV